MTRANDGLYRWDEEAIRRLAASNDAAGVLLAEFDLWEEHGRGDLDQLYKLASAFLQARFVGLSPAVHTWLMANPTPVRAEIAGWFLSMYWGHVSPHEPLVNDLIALTDSLVPHPDQLMAVLWALTEAAARKAPHAPAAKKRLVQLAARGKEIGLQAGILAAIRKL